MEARLSNHFQEVLVAAHPLPQGTVRLPPPSRLRLLPVEILDPNHLHARHGQIGGDPPACYAALGCRVLQVEIIAGPLRVQSVHDSCHVPHLPPEISGVIMVSHLNPMLLRKCHQPPKLPARFLKLLSYIDEFVAVVTRFYKWD